ncbi:MAG TPA: DUF1501 domain-containing protein [Pirellulales bacterium]|nr:DUF1501 domain-containing protein [Pirellulales bacterium]
MQPSTSAPAGEHDCSRRCTTSFALARDDGSCKRAWPESLDSVCRKCDNHGDDVIWGGLIKGLKPLFPSVDRSVYALVTDLQARGLLDNTLIVVMGEFGRSPVISSTGGRTHWFNCMSVLLAGGGLAHGQVIGSTDERGYDIRDGRVSPADLAATVFQHLEIDLTTQWTDPQGRPHPIVSDGGRPIAGLS